MLGCLAGPARVAAVAATLLCACGVAQEARAQADGVRWGGEVHTDRDSLEAWLRARGADYEVWAERHPEAAARLEEREDAAPPEADEEPDEEGADEALLPGIVPLGFDEDGLTPRDAILIGALALSILLLAAGALLMASRTATLLPPALAVGAGRRGAIVAGAGVLLLAAVLLASLFV